MQPSELVTEGVLLRALAGYEHAEPPATFVQAMRAALEAAALDLYERGLRDAAEECARREAAAMERAAYFGPCGDGWRTHCGGASGASSAHADYKRAAIGWRHASDAILSKLRSAT